MMNRLVMTASTLVAVLAFTFTSDAHELDHFNVPHGRTFADVGDYVAETFYDNITDAVRKTNHRIASRGTSGRELERLQSPFTIAEAVLCEFPTFFTYIEDLEAEFHSDRLKERYPGLLVAHWPKYCVYDDAIFALDPRQFYLRWRSSTLLIDGHYIGTDKLGHFVHNGWNYYLEYNRVLRAGGSEDVAMRAAVEVGSGDNFLLSERGMLGVLSSGVMSNADLAANYTGLLFFLNLTQPMMLQGEVRPALLELRDGKWHLTDRLRNNPDTLKLFFSDHMDEALNPNVYDAVTARAMHKAILPHCERLRRWYVDDNGDPYSRQYFEQQAELLETYYGENYGHTGKVDGMVSTIHVCFCELDEDATPLKRLHAAALSNDVEAAAAALEAGADVNESLTDPLQPITMNGITLLHIAAADGHIEILRLLLEHDANVDARTVHAVTPLHLGVKSVAVIDELISAGADLNAQDDLGRTALFRAARCDASKSVERLLRAGADATIQDIDGETALHTAVRRGHAAAVEALLEDEALINSRARYGVTPLHLAARYGRIEIARMLVASHADLNAADEFGRQPLHEAALADAPALAELLLTHGADAHAGDLHGRTPIQYAARCAHHRMVKQLTADDTTTAVEASEIPSANNNATAATVDQEAGKSQ